MSLITLSGLTPTSSGIHLGNYFGAVRQWIDLQDGGGAHYFIASYHALTTVRDPAQLSSNIRAVAMDYLALGLDPERAVIYRQEDVPEVCELAWILSCVTSKGMMDKAHAFKDAVAKGKEVNVGLLLSMNFHTRFHGHVEIAQARQEKPDRSQPHKFPDTPP
jgi:tryptophanyl-tRNA synthetase